MKHGIVFGVDLVTTVDVPECEERVEAGTNQLGIVTCGVSAQQMTLVYVEAVFLRATDVVGGRQEASLQEKETIRETDLK